MPTIANVRMRQLPLGDTLQRTYQLRKRALPLGRLLGDDDDGLDDITISSDEYNYLTTGSTGFDGSFSFTPAPLASGFTPETVDVDQSAINQAIGYDLQDAAVNASNASRASTGLTSNAQAGNIPGGSSLNTSAIAQALTSVGASRPSPLTTPVGYTTTPATLATANNALAQSSIISGIPNWMVLAGIVGVGLFASSGSGRR